MGNNHCKFSNDTDYPVDIVDYDGTRRLSPGSTQSNYLVKGPFYVTLKMTLPDGTISSVNFFGSSYQGLTHLMSEIFKDPIERLEEGVKRID